MQQRKNSKFAGDKTTNSRSENLQIPLIPELSEYFDNGDKQPNFFKELWTDQTIQDSIEFKKYEYLPVRQKNM